MSWQPTIGQTVRYIGPDDGHGCKPGVRGVVTSLHDDIESYCGQADRPIAVRLFNGWPAAFAASELEPTMNDPLDRVLKAADDLFAEAETWIQDTEKLLKDIHDNPPCAALVNEKCDRCGGDLGSNGATRVRMSGQLAGYRGYYCAGCAAPVERCDGCGFIRCACDE